MVHPFVIGSNPILWGKLVFFARVAELVDARDLKSRIRYGCRGSSPFSGIEAGQVGL
jgi:hypothetical protein